jgi:hypothetical protein
LLEANTPFNNAVYSNLNSSNANSNISNAISITANLALDYFGVRIKSEILSVSIVNPGSGYNANSFLVFTGGEGKGANASYTVNSTGSITAVVLNERGINYTSAPTITANGSNIVPATFTSTLEYAGTDSGTVLVGRFL